jgi:hypothetical protein
LCAELFEEREVDIRIDDVLLMLCCGNDCSPRVCDSAVPPRLVLGVWVSRWRDGGKEDLVVDGSTPLVGYCSWYLTR